MRQARTPWAATCPSTAWASAPCASPATASGATPPTTTSAIRVLRRAVELGVDLIDTADSYGPFVERGPDRRGAAPVPRRARHRHQGRPHPQRPRGVGAGRPARVPAPVRRDVACGGSSSSASTSTSSTASTRRCRSTESLGALVELQRQGKIRHIGVSNVDPGGAAASAQSVADVVSVQNRYNLADRESEDVLDACDRRGHRVHPVVPAGHRRAGPTRRSARPGRRAHGATPAQLALAWLLHHSPVMLPIPGTVVGRPPRGEHRRGHHRAHRRGVGRSRSLGLGEAGSLTDLYGFGMPDASRPTPPSRPVERP